MQLEAFSNFRTKVNQYYQVSEESLMSLKPLMSIENIKNNDFLVKSGDIAKNIYFISTGIVRSFITDENGTEYNKSIFFENDFVTSTTSCLLSKQSDFAIEALEDSTLISMNFHDYKQVINQHDDLRRFYIAYIEKEWIIEKEKREVSIVMENATIRYLKLLDSHPNIEERIAQHHIASHLGITPTQLSRIKKQIKNASNQHM